MDMERRIWRAKAVTICTDGHVHIRPIDVEWFLLHPDTRDPVPVVPAFRPVPQSTN